MKVKHKKLGLDLEIRFTNEAAVSFEHEIKKFHDLKEKISAREYWQRIVQIGIDAGAILSDDLGEGVTSAAGAAPNVIEFMATEIGKAYKAATEIDPE